MNELDDVLKDALDPGSADVESADFTIRDEFGEIFDSFRGQSRMISLMWIVDVLVLTALGVFTAVLMFRAEDVRMTVIWAAATLGLVMTIGLTKIGFFMMLNRNRVVREVKRLELRIAVLSERLGGDGG